MDGPALLKVDRLRKSYGDHVAVEDVSFEVHEGEVFGLLGPNGAGKSTTIGCISALLRPSSGTIAILGYDVVTDGAKARKRLGVVPQDLAIYPDLSALRNVSYWGSAYGLAGQELRSRAHEVLERVGLLDRATDRPSTFSGGMKRRLNLACGVVHHPSVLLLDEPTVGVDPQSRRRLLELVKEEAERGAAVVYTTHYMEEAQELCNHLAIVDRGSVLAAGTLQELREQIGERDVVRLTGTFEEDTLRDGLAAIDGLEVLSLSEDSLALAAAEASLLLPQVYNVIAGSKGVVRETTITQPNLESLFIKLTGRELRK